MISGGEVKKATLNPSLQALKTGLKGLEKPIQDKIIKAHGSTISQTPVRLSSSNQTGKSTAISAKRFVDKASRYIDRSDLYDLADKLHGMPRDLGGRALASITQNAFKNEGGSNA